MAGAEMRGTSIGAPEVKYWGFTTRCSWFIPSHSARITAEIGFAFLLVVVPDGLSSPFDYPRTKPLVLRTSIRESRPPR